MDPAADLKRWLVDQSPDAVIFADRDGVIVEWNPAATALFGFSRDEAAGSSLDLIVPERFREAHWRGYARALADGDTKYHGQSLPTRSQRKDGSTLYVELTFAIVHGADGSVLGALAHARDITQRWARDREQREQLRTLEEQLAKAQQASEGLSSPAEQA